jgi:hypothetical protein
MSEIYTQPFQIRVDDPNQGPKFVTVDFSLFKTGDFYLELTSANPSQSKQAQTQMLMQLVQLLATNPQGALMAEPALRELAALGGIKNIQNVLDELKEKMASMPPPQPEQKK